MTDPRLEAAKERLRSDESSIGGVMDFYTTSDLRRALLRVLEKVPVPNEPGVDPLLIGHGQGIQEAQDEILDALEEK